MMPSMFRPHSPEADVRVDAPVLTVRSVLATVAFDVVVAVARPLVATFGLILDYELTRRRVRR